MNKPVLLVDVDGVLNPFSHRGDFAPGWETHQITAQNHMSQMKTYEVYLLPRHGSWLLELAADFELVWATTWEEQANTLIGPKIGLPPLPVAPIYWRMSGYNKTMGIEEIIGDRPAAWLDDEPGSAGHYWRDERMKRGVPTLLVTTDPAIGFTRGQKDRLHRFATSLRK